MGSTVCVAACVDGAELDKGGERACTTSAISASSVLVAAITAAVAADAADAAAGSVTSAGATVVSRLPGREGVSSASSSIHGGFLRCGFLSCNSTCTSATLGARFSCTCGWWVLHGWAVPGSARMG